MSSSSALWIRSAGDGENALELDGQRVPVRFIRNTRARRFVLRLRHDGVASVTIPRGASQRDASDFLNRQRDWLASQVRRRAVLREQAPADDQVLQARVRARLELSHRTFELADSYGLKIRQVRIGKGTTRWGSCSSRHIVTLNWRLMLTPDWVRDYVIVHELMHLREMNHSGRFWLLVEQQVPHWREAEAWLTKHGPVLLQV